MSANLLATMSLGGLDLSALRPPAPSLLDRLQAWLALVNRTRLARSKRALLERYARADRGDVLALDGLRSTPAGRMARLRAAADGSIDTVVSVGALADAADVGALLSEIKRVLRPGGRLLFVEPVTAPAGTRLRRVQRALDRFWRMLAGSVSAPRDLWNDLKAARFGRLAFEQVSLRALGGFPVPHLVGEAALPVAAARPAAAAAAAVRPGSTGTPALGWSAPAFAFFG